MSQRSQQNTKWFVEIGGKELGPYSAQRLKQLAHQGMLTSTTLVREVRMERPAPAGRVLDLFQLSGQDDTTVEPSVDVAVSDEYRLAPLDEGHQTQQLTHETSVAQSSAMAVGSRDCWNPWARIVDWIRELIQDAGTWARGQNWLIRMPLLLYGALVLYRTLFAERAMTPFDFLNFCLHEMGHMVFMVIPAPVWIGVIAGTAAQYAAPIYSVWMFLRQRDYFATAFCFCWIAENLHHTSWYIADAKYRKGVGLQIFGPGEYIHDWEYILSGLGLLSWAVEISYLIQFLAILSAAWFLFSGSWLLYRMVRPRAPRAN